MNGNLNNSEIDLLINKSIDKIPFEIKKIKFALFFIKTINKHKGKKDYFIRIILIVYLIFTFYYFFVK